MEAERWVAVARRRAPLFLAVALAIFAAFVARTMLTQPTYTAEAEVVVDARHEQIVDAQPVVQELSRSNQEANIVDTQVAIMRSRQLAASVVRDLKLVDDPEFNTDLTPKIGLPTWLAPARPKPDEAQTREKVTDALLDSLAIRRTGLTYVIGITVTSTDPVKAARIANAYADAYLSMTWDLKADSTRRVNEWVSARLEGLRQQVESSEAEIQAYKIANKLLSASGVPLNEAEISNFNQQTANARAGLAEDVARLNTARAQLAQGSSGEDVGEALGSNVVMELRRQRGAISVRYASIEGIYGPKHPELAKARQEMADIDAQIQAEVRRIISNLDAKVQVSQQRLASVQSTLNNAEGVLETNNRASVRLNELQRNADAAKAVYETFLNRYKETNAMAGMVAPDARLLSRASAPSLPASPDLKLDLVLGALIALMGGLAVVVMAEVFNSGLSTAEDIEDRIGAPCLGSVPSLRSTRCPEGSASAYLTSKPRSAFAESFKVLHASLLQLGDGMSPRVVAITSSLPGEGKTVTSACFAGSLARQGYRTVLVDCDEYRASLTGQIKQPRFGVLEVLQGLCSLETALVRDERTGVMFLPLVRSEDVPEDLLASDAMKDLLRRLRREYDVVILDTKPVIGVANTRVLAPMADAVVLLAQWRKTPRKAIETSLKVLDRAGAKVAGVVLTQVDMKQQARTGYGDPNYYQARYAKYYQE